VWAICRTDCRVTLIEPLLRRSTFLEESVARLGLGDRVTVMRGRAEDAGQGQFDVVTARAVAPLERLLPWTMPLVAPGGRLVALKGAGAEAEIASASAIARGLGVPTLQVVQVGQGVVDPPTTVVIGIRSPR
jgi:16S rRNA (guanine527-N7)-methyltransferase